MPGPSDLSDPRPLARSAPAFDPGPVTLTGRLARLEPVEPRHFAGLARIAFDPETWRWTREQSMDDEAALHRYVDGALAEAAAGRAVPFAQIDAVTGVVAGMTRYHSIERTHRRLEIGWTWIAAPWRGTGFNAEAKLLLLRQAFDGWGAHRVEFKTDAQNTRSRAALAAIGATEEGTLRRHVITERGRVRDSVYFSVIWEEWPRVEAHLESRVAGALTRR
jgi:RimJ/RimL family protein N-acetyltransferase